MVEGNLFWDYGEAFKEPLNLCVKTSERFLKLIKLDK